MPVERGGRNPKREGCCWLRVPCPGTGTSAPGSQQQESARWAHGYPFFSSQRLCWEGCEQLVRETPAASQPRRLHSFVSQSFSSGPAQGEAEACARQLGSMPTKKGGKETPETLARAACLRQGKEAMSALVLRWKRRWASPRGAQRNKVGAAETVCISKLTGVTTEQPLTATHNSPAGTGLSGEPEAPHEMLRDGVLLGHTAVALLPPCSSAAQLTCPTTHSTACRGCSGHAPRDGGLRRGEPGQPWPSGGAGTQARPSTLPLWSSMPLAFTPTLFVCTDFLLYIQFTYLFLVAAMPPKTTETHGGSTNG